MYIKIIKLPVKDNLKKLKIKSLKLENSLDAYSAPFSFIFYTKSTLISKLYTNLITTPL